MLKFSIILNSSVTMIIMILNFGFKIYLAKELKALRDFKQFEILSKLVRELAKQAQCWLNSQNHYPQKG